MARASDAGDRGGGLGVSDQIHGPSGFLILGQEPRTDSKLVGYSVSNRVRVKIRQIDQVGDILDRLLTAGATDIGSVEFLVSEPSTALDHAREVAIADARRKAEVYAQASAIRLGRLNGSRGVWICPTRSPRR